MELFKLLGKISIDASGVDEAVGKVKSKIETLGENISKVGEKVSSAGGTLTKKLTVPLTAIGTLSTKTAANFEDGMLKVQSLSGATDEEYKKLTEAAKKYGETTAWSASDVADAMGYMALAGFDTNEILDSTSGMLSLASASGEDLATVTDILTDSMTAFGDGADQASRYADVLATTQAKSNTTVGLLGEAFKYAAPLAGSYGYKLEDVSTALGMMANAGVKGSMAGTALSSIITRLGTDTDGCRGQIEEMGISFYNSDGTARNLSDVLKDLCDKTQGFTVEQKAAIAKTIAGQEAQKGLLAILNQGSGAYQDLQSKIENCNGAASDMSTNMESGLGGSIRSLKSALEGVSITLGEKLAPYVKFVADKIKELTVWFQNLDDKTQDNIVRFGLLLAIIGPVLAVFGKGITVVGNVITVGAKLFSGIGSIISIGGKLLGGIGSIASFVVTKLIPAIAGINPIVLVIIAAIGAAIAIGVALYKNWDEISEFASKVWDKIAGFVGAAKDKIVGFFKNIMDWIGDNWQGLVALIVNPFVGGFKLLYDNCEQFREFIDGFLGKIHDIFSGAVTKITDKAKELKENVVNAAHELKDKAAEAFDGLKDRWQAGFSAAKDKIVSLASELRDGAVAKIQELRDSASSKIGEFTDKAVSKFGELKEKGFAAVQSLKEAAMTKFSEMGDSIGSKFTKVADTVTGIFDKAKENVSKIAETVKGLFKFDWKLPDIKLPHFKVNWETSGTIAGILQKFGLEGLPKIGVDWYAKAMKNPMIMEQPTAFGINRSGQIMAGGETGSEVVSGTDTLMNMISAAVAAKNQELYELLSRILEMLREYMPAMANLKVVMDTGEVVGVLADPMNQQLGKLTQMRGRRN